jgi:NADH-quinone oxidoreductase subunit N
MDIPVIDISAVYPELVITLTGLFVLAVDVFLKPEKKTVLAVVSVVGLLVAFLISAAVLVAGRNDTAFSGMVVVDAYAQFFKIIFFLSAVLTIFMSPRYLRLFNISQGEYFQLILFSTLGMMVMVAANDLVTIYIGLELMAISIYLMAGFEKNNPRSSEASLKYFLLGAFASGILLYGMSFLYGITGTTSLEGIAADFAGKALNPKLMTLALVLITVGFAFKIAAVPFHMWTPDVYVGAPTPLTAFMSVGPKVAGFAVIMRMYMTSFESQIADWTQLFWILCVLTMIVGNIIAVAQKNIKRMLAYSSIAHAGYLLIGVISAGRAVELPGNTLLRISEAMSSVMIYLFAYLFMNLGAFAVVIMLAREDDHRELLDDYAGLARRRPIVAMLMAVLMLSLAGIPPTFGFIGKLYIFMAAIHTYNVPLAIIGVLASVIAAFYYIRVIVYMYMREPEEKVTGDTDAPSSAMYATIVACAFTVIFGVWPIPIINWARYAIEQMLG